jgi:hypothetical protein
MVLEPLTDGKWSCRADVQTLRIFEEDAVTNRSVRLIEAVKTICDRGKCL